jgi:hypothetical protein
MPMAMGIPGVLADPGVPNAQGDSHPTRIDPSAPLNPPTPPIALQKGRSTHGMILPGASRIAGIGTTAMEIAMTLYMNLISRIAGAPSLVDRLTAVFRRDSGRERRPTAPAQSSQSPPSRKHGIWAHRLRIQTIRMNDLSPHLRRDIGLER